MKKIIVLMMLAIIPMSIIAADGNEKKDSIPSNTKYGALFLQRGRLKKFEDFKIEKISLRPYGMPIKIKVHFRKFYHKLKNSYYLILEAGDEKAYIEYSDLVEINKAIIKLKSEVENDCLKKPEYLENQYVTVDDFAIGYWVKKKLGKYEPTWYLDFNRTSIIYDSIDIEVVSKMFLDKQAQIEKMMEMDK